MTPSGNSSISMVAIEKLVLRPQWVLGEHVFVGFQYA